MVSAPEIEITPETNYSDIIVPTQDTIRMSQLLSMLLTNKKPVSYFIGLFKEWSSPDELHPFILKYI